MSLFRSSRKLSRALSVKNKSDDRNAIHSMTETTSNDLTNVRHLEVGVEATSSNLPSDDDGAEFHAMRRSRWRLSRSKSKRASKKVAKRDTRLESSTSESQQNQQQQPAHPVVDASTHQLHVAGLNEDGTTGHGLSRKPSKFVRRGMDKLRRSMRSLRKGSKEPPEALASKGAASGTSAAGGDAKPQQWQQDEMAVRANTCTFNVKYLGCVEVFESRGMQVCEEALKVLRQQRRRTVRAVLYVSGDGLRVVDADTNRGLLLDQTIEKVSFCAPDRNNEKGFAYICRDGTTRRWMCHGFNAVKETGERLSHAVGCAFAVCLERKQKRDKDATQIATNEPNTPSKWSDPAPPSIGQSSTSSSTSASRGNGTAFERAIGSSFRQATLNERKLDPQSVIVVEPSGGSDVNTAHLPSPATSPRGTPSTAAVARPTSNMGLFERQATGSLRMPQAGGVTTQPFKRQASLRTDMVTPIKMSSPSTSIAQPPQGPLPVQQQQQSSPIPLAAQMMLQQQQQQREEAQRRMRENAEEKERIAESERHAGDIESAASYAPEKIKSPKKSPFQRASTAKQTTQPIWDQTFVEEDEDIHRYQEERRNRSEEDSLSVTSSTARSRAEEWLQSTLRASVRRTPPHSPPSTSMKPPSDEPSSMSVKPLTHEPSHPPPPIPRRNDMRPSFSSNFSSPKHQQESHVQPWLKFSPDNDGQTPAIVQQHPTHFNEPLSDASTSGLNPNDPFSPLHNRELIDNLPNGHDVPDGRVDYARSTQHTPQRSAPVMPVTRPSDVRYDYPPGMSETETKKMETKKMETKKMETKKTEVTTPQRSSVYDVKDDPFSPQHNQDIIESFRQASPRRSKDAPPTSVFQPAVDPFEMKWQAFGNDNENPFSHESSGVNI